MFTVRNILCAALVAVSSSAYAGGLDRLDKTVDLQSVVGNAVNGTLNTVEALPVAGHVVGVIPVHRLSARVPVLNALPIWGRDTDGRAFIEPTVEGITDAELDDFERQKCRILYPSGAMNFQLNSASIAGRLRATAQVVSTCGIGRKYRIVAMKGVEILERVPVHLTSNSGAIERRELILVADNGRSLSGNVYQGGATPNTMHITAFLDQPFSISGDINMPEGITLAVIPD